MGFLFRRRFKKQDHSTAPGSNYKPKVGDIVLIDRHYFGDKMTVNGADQVLISEGNILGKLEE